MLGRFVALVGAFVIHRLIDVFGRRIARASAPWLRGPVGGDRIGDAPYREVAEAENLDVERDAKDGGLVPDFTVLAGPSADVTKLHPKVRDFYEHTSRYAMDVWSESYFPGRIGLWLLVKTISRQVNQLNFPLSPLDTARGMASEIIAMRDGAGQLRYTGWFRTIGAGRTVLYTGFYSTERPPNERGACVKVVFPMPRGNATVILRPTVTEDGALLLDSSGERFGDAGFYRVHDTGGDSMRVWHVRSLKEHFHVYVDDAGALRCDHVVTFWGSEVLRLHYKIFERGAAATA